MKIGTERDEVGNARSAKSDLSPRSAKKQFIAAKPGQPDKHHRSCIDTVTSLSEKKSERTPNKPISNTHAKPAKAMSDMNKARSAKGDSSPPNKPISNTHAKPVKAMPDMNKARSEKAIYG